MRFFITVFLIAFFSMSIIPQKKELYSAEPEYTSGKENLDNSRIIKKPAGEFKNARAEINKNEALLFWSAKEDSGIVNYIVEKFTGTELLIVGVIKAKGSRSIQTDYDFSEILTPDELNLETILYRVSAADSAGTKLIWQEFKIQPSQIVEDFELYQNYPNPFNPLTKIKYKVPQTEHVSIKVYNILGNEVAVIVDEILPAGTYEADFNASGLTSGVYLYTLQAGELTETKRMILMK